MSTNLIQSTDAPSEEPPVVHAIDDNDLFVVARYPYQMDRCQDALKAWASRKIEQVSAEAEDLRENVEIARKNGWGMSALIRAERLARKRVTFYEKIKAALEAGHCIVPNFPVDMIAVRTSKESPDPMAVKARWLASGSHDQPCERLPAGKGEFQNPTPIVYQRNAGVDDKGHQLREYFAKEWADMEFPFTTAKPQILSATARAMTDRVFDEIGVLPGKKKREDPIVVGRIIDPRSTTYNRIVVTFLIAWFLDTRTL